MLQFMVKSSWIFLRSNEELIFIKFKRLKSMEIYLSNKNNDLLRIFAICRKLIIIINFNFRIKIPSSQRIRIYANFSWIVFPICHKIFVTKLHFSNFYVQNRNRISFRHLPIIGCKSGVQIRSINKKKNKNEEIFDRLFNEFISNVDAFFQFETSESRGRNRRIGMEATMRLLSMSDGLTSSNYENGCKTKEGLMRNCKGDKLPTLLLWRNTLCKLCLCPIKFN